jgi:hypothetical protein
MGARVSLLTRPDPVLRQRCFDVTIIAPDGNPLYDSDPCGSSDFSNAVTLSTTGTYAILVRPDSAGTGKAKLTLFTVPPDAMASLAIGSSANLATVIPGQGMQVTFFAAAGQKANVSVVTDDSLSSACYTVNLLKPDSSILRTEQSCDQSYLTGIQTLPMTGTYTIAVASTDVAVGGATIGVNPP